MGIGAEGGFGVCLRGAGGGGLGGTMNCGLWGADGSEGVGGADRHGDAPLVASKATE